MVEMPADWSALCAIVFLLGMRHGFDADHLAAIDGLTRLSTRAGLRHARWCGALFSIGHGAIVMAIAVAVGLLSTRWAPPVWLDLFGAWVSIGFLVLIGVANLSAVLRTAPGNLVALVGVRAQWLARWPAVRGPFGVAAIGALFAVSFDTISQAALFAVTATQFGGVPHAMALGLLFVLGMLVADGVNGWWISRLIARADDIAALASRVMSLAVAAVSLLVAGLGAGKLLSPTIDRWAEGRDLVMGTTVVVVIALSYAAALLLSRRVVAGSAGS